MIIREFAKPVTSKTLNETLAAKFGTRIALDKFTLEQLQDARNRLRTKLRQVETMESFDAVKNETYQKSKMIIDVLNAAISERGSIDDVTESTALKEGEEDKAELVMAAKDMVDRVTGWMEDTAEMQTESMLELADAIRDELGQESSEQFTSTVKPALDSLFAALEATRNSLTQGVGQLTGEAGPTDMMGADDDMGMDDMGGMDDMDDAGLDAPEDDIAPIDADDEFGGTAADAGSDAPADRAKRESVERKPVKKDKEKDKKKVKTTESFDPHRIALIMSKKK